MAEATNKLKLPRSLALGTFSPVRTEREKSQMSSGRSQRSGMKLRTRSKESLKQQSKFTVKTRELALPGTGRTSKDVTPDKIAANKAMSADQMSMIVEELNR